MKVESGADTYYIKVINEFVQKKQKTIDIQINFNCRLLFFSHNQY